MHVNVIYLIMINCQNVILMQQHKFPYNVKLINFMRILSVAANSVNEIYFMNAYNDTLIYQQLYLICPCGERDGERVNL